MRRFTWPQNPIPHLPEIPVVRQSPPKVSWYWRRRPKFTPLHGEETAYFLPYSRLMFRLKDLQVPRRRVTPWHYRIRRFFTSWPMSVTVGPWFMMKGQIIADGLVAGQ